MTYGLRGPKNSPTVSRAFHTCTLLSIVIWAGGLGNHGHDTLHGTNMANSSRCAPPTKGASTPPTTTESSESSVL